MKRWLFLTLLAVAGALSAEHTFALDGLRVDAFHLGEGEQIQTETWMRAQEVHIEGDAEADLFILATQARLSGFFLRSLWVLSDQITLDGQCSDVARLAGRVVLVEGELNGDLRAMGETVKIGEHARVDGDVWIFGDTVICEGEFMGPVHITARTINLAGRFHGLVHAEGLDITFMPGSEFHENVTYRAANELFPGGRVTFHGALERLEPQETAARRGTLSRLFTASIFFLGALMAGMPFVALFPSYAARAVDALHLQRTRCLLTGLTSLILIPLAALLSLSTLIGIPLGLLLSALFAGLLYLSRFVIALILGGILFRGRKPESISQVMLMMAAGLLVFYALIFLPYIGWTLRVVLTIFGLGALLRALFVRPQLPVAAPAENHSGSSGS